MPRAAGDDRPDVYDDIVVEHVIRVVPVHGARRVSGHQGDGVTDRQGRPARGGEDAVLLVEPEDREVVAGERHVRGVRYRLVTGIDDHLAALPADDGRLDRERVPEAGHHLAVEVVHDYVGAGLNLGQPRVPGRPLPCGYPARRPDLAWNAVRLQQAGDAGEERHRLALAFMAQITVGCQRAMPFVSGDSLEFQPRK